MHLNSSQRAGIFAHTAGNASQLIYDSQFLCQHDAPPLLLQGLVVKHAVAETLEARICNLLLELLTHTFGCLCALYAAGTVSAGTLEPLPDGLNDLLIWIEFDFHVCHLFLYCGFIIPHGRMFFCDEVTLIKNPVLKKAPDFLKFER